MDDTVGFIIQPFHLYRLGKSDLHPEAHHSTFFPASV